MLGSNVDQLVTIHFVPPVRAVNLGRLPPYYHDSVQGVQAMKCSSYLCFSALLMVTLGSDKLFKLQRQSLQAI